MTDLTTLTSLSQLQSHNQNQALSPDQQARIEKTAQEFEALVLSQLLAPVFASVQESDLTSGGPQADAFQTLLQEEYAKSIAARGGLGIADQVKSSLIALQAEQQSSLNF